MIESNLSATKTLVKDSKLLDTKKKTHTAKYIIMIMVKFTLI